ncbi:hypothetical protein JHK82_049102 [Glycine max]|uniref:Uncharacterized protein n=1 Tax=Glycine max TaxID=3847 RepID=A0A0R0F660_SOYBN|nr:hypothetical protein JHK86_048961 [Glycine max]KAG4923203.1 hypothetical protein JHK87_048743 [Glycine soja]KAG5090324.1 hypothetical protein JHK82_049102 [Glycine max]KAG5093403.1 hypothetical protein JHK84_048991 [Glycine max]KAH1152770.1 hypothetical protein GYH30_048739 [Glycine max]
MLYYNINLCQKLFKKMASVKGRVYTPVLLLLVYSWAYGWILLVFYEGKWTVLIFWTCYKSVLFAPNYCKKGPEELIQICLKLLGIALHTSILLVHPA